MFRATSVVFDAAVHKAVCLLMAEICGDGATSSGWYRLLEAGTSFWQDALLFDRSELS